jgi:hypothetical protein
MGGTSGGGLDDEYRRLGALLLGLVADWDAWVSRRVESFYFAGDDERVLHRRQSVDFALPPFILNAPPSLFNGFGGFPVPLTFVRKWRLPEFSLRDESNRAASLLQREHSTRLSGAMLVALATFAKTGGEALCPPAGSDERLPAKLEEELVAIAAGDPSPAMRRCVTLERGDGDGPRAAEWRRALVEDEVFMSLAYELARGFPLLALVPEEHLGGIHLLKFEYNAYVVSAQHDRWSVRLAHAPRWIRNLGRDSIDASEWESRARRRIAGPETGPADPGRLVISTSPTQASKKVRHRSGEIACGIVTIDGPKGRRAIRLRPVGVVALAGLAAGRYRIRIEDCSGFVNECEEDEFEIRGEETKRIHVSTARKRFTSIETLAPAPIASPAWRPKRWSRGVGWSSKPLVVRIRFGGGEYSCRFEAPPGIHATRGRLISNLDGNARPHGDDGAVEERDDRERYVDTVLESGQWADLESTSPAASRPSTGYVFVNLRPRRETIVRPALLTAFVTFVVIAGLAARWDGSWFGNDGPNGLLGALLALFFGEGNQSSDPPWGLLAVLLGGPSALAAYFAQAIPSRVTNAMLFGLRLTALIPVALSLLAAGALLDTSPLNTQSALIFVAALAGITCVTLGAAHYFAEHPLEQNPTPYRQGPKFAAAHLDGGETEAPRGRRALDVLDRKSLGPREGSLSEAIRDRMLERSAGLTAATRRTLLGQRWFRFWEQEIPPALYFDSAESTAVFLGLGTDEEEEDLHAAFEVLAEQVESETPRIPQR